MILYVQILLIIMCFCALTHSLGEEPSPSAARGVSPRMFVSAVGEQLELHAPTSRKLLEHFDKTMVGKAEGYAPGLVHLSRTTNRTSEMTVTFQTFSETPFTQCRYAIDQGNNTKLSMLANGTSHAWEHKGVFPWKRVTHVVTLTGLKENTTYYYVCEVGNRDTDRTEVLSFKTWSDDLDRPANYIVFGDLGYFNAKSVPLLLWDAETDDYAGLIHVGDVAYNMDNNGGLWGDLFFDMMQPIASRLPYYLVQGNHDLGDVSFHWRNRLVLPMKETNGNFYYSWDAGRAHFIMVETECFFDFAKDAFPPEHNCTRQFEWLRADLERANRNRAERPWIILFTHHPMYCTNRFDDAIGGCHEVGANATMRHALEPLLCKAGVDLFIAGHMHIYESFYPMYNWTAYGSDDSSLVEPKATVHVTSGSAGCSEGLGSFHRVRPFGTRKRIRAYGYGHLRVQNRTHLHWEQLDDDDGKVVDEFWIVKKSHGPFSIC